MKASVKVQLIAHYEIDTDRALSYGIEDTEGLSDDQIIDKMIDLDRGNLDDILLFLDVVLSHDEDYIVTISRDEDKTNG